MTLGIIGHDFAYELECVVRLFFPGNKINVVKQNNITDDGIIMTRLISLGKEKQSLIASVKLGDFEKQTEIKLTASIPRDNGILERTLAAMLFRLLSKYTVKTPEWGILTGIRPVSLCNKWEKEGLTEHEIFTRLTNDYLVSEKKARLCLKTARGQKHIIRDSACECYSLYISIPFCPTRCLYCSFISHAIDKAMKLVYEYVGLLCKEIEYTGKLARALGLKLKTVYIGGGTPTTLSEEQLYKILEAVDASFDIQGVTEYSVEAGRPDTITQEKLKVLRDFGVGRISVNPQSMNDHVLNAIGRRHNSEEVCASVELVKDMGFTCINMDIIAGLPLETIQSFEQSLLRVLALKPHNITLHSLAVKRSSHLREDKNAFLNVNAESGKMLGYAEEKLENLGYLPYYLYKQKAAVENLENIGYSLTGQECAYNILSMSDAHTILAAGAGAVSKLCIKEGSVRRIFNYKFPYEYITNFDDALKRKGDAYATDH